MIINHLDVLPQETANDLSPATDRKRASSSVATPPSKVFRFELKDTVTQISNHGQLSKCPPVVVRLQLDTSTPYIHIFILHRLP